MKRFACGFLAALAMSSVAVADPNSPKQLIGFDDFDTLGVYLTRTINPDLSGSSIPGSFPGSRLDVFGVVDRNVNFDFADDSVSIFPGDTLGIMPESDPDNLIFGVEDLENGDNPGGTGTATWTFDVSGISDLEVTLDVAAMGDFEASDSFEFTWSIDGSAPTTLFSFVALENETFEYEMANGTTDVLIDDPLSVSGDPNDPNNVVDNNLDAIDAEISGTGNVLTITFSATQNGGGEVFGFDNLRVFGVFDDEPDCGAFCQVDGGCADVNGDGQVNLSDLGILLSNFGEAEPDVDNEDGDINGDGAVTLTDLSIILSLFGVDCS